MTHDQVGGIDDFVRRVAAASERVTAAVRGVSCAAAEYRQALDDLMRLAQEWPIGEASPMRPKTTRAKPSATGKRRVEAVTDIVQVRTLARTVKEPQSERESSSTLTVEIRAAVARCPDGATVRDLANMLGKPYGTVYSAVMALVKAGGLSAKEGTKAYVLVE